jgi:Ca2+-binding RTX toxin-like protein
MFGGSGNDTLFAGLRSHLTGGSGHDTFQIDLAPPDSPVPDGAVITDFHHGEDVILIGDVGSGASLTHNGDLWTIHDGSDQLTFEVSGVTQLQAGVDYEFS